MKSLPVILVLALATPAMAAQKKAAPAASEPLVKAVAGKLEARQAPEGRHVYYCDEVYAKANGDFDSWLKANNYPPSAHAGILDTSAMLFLGGDKAGIRKDLVASALGDPVLPRDQAPDPASKRINNGITGDGRKATAELGRKIIEMKVDYAVAQIQKLMAARTAN